MNMKTRTLTRLGAWSGIVSSVVLCFIAAPAFAGISGNSQPGARSTAEHEDSVVQRSSLEALSEAAELTAAFNVGSRTMYPPNLPFQILYTSYDPTAANNTGGIYTTFMVDRGTRLYVPVIYNDNSEPIIGGKSFPPADDRRALLHYIFSEELFGLDYAKIVVDGKVAKLGRDYVVELEFPPSVLPDTATLYQTIAAFLTPLKTGTHSVEITAKATGEAFSIPPFDIYFPGGVFSFSTTYTVIVQ